MITTTEQRVIQERDELRDRINKLGLFISTNSKYTALSRRARRLLRKQYKHMVAYHNILTARLDCWED